MSVSPVHGRDLAGVAGGRLDQAQRRGADGNDPPARAAGGGDLGGGRIADLAPFGMHPVGRHVLDLDRQEGARADMQRDMADGHAHLAQLVQQIVVEMQRCRGRRDRPRDARPDGLVILAVLRIGGAARGDIGRQGHRARRIEGRVEIPPREVEAQPPLPLILGLEHGRQRVGKDDLARLRTAS